jgi:hypothetical protein
MAPSENYSLDASGYLDIPIRLYGKNDTVGVEYTVSLLFVILLPSFHLAVFDL